MIPNIESLGRVLKPTDTIPMAYVIKNIMYLLSRSINHKAIKIANCFYRDDSKYGITYYNGRWYSKCSSVGDYINDFERLYDIIDNNVIVKNRFMLKDERLYPLLKKGYKIKVRLFRETDVFDFITSHPYKEAPFPILDNDAFWHNPFKLQDKYKCVCIYIKPVDVFSGKIWEDDDFKYAFGFSKFSYKLYLKDKRLANLFGNASTNVYNFLRYPTDDYNYTNDIIIKLALYKSKGIIKNNFQKPLSYILSDEEIRSYYDYYRSIYCIKSNPPCNLNHCRDII